MVSQILRAPPRDMAQLEAYLERQRKKLALLTEQDASSSTYHGVYADISVLRRMLREGRRVMDSLVRKARRRKMQDARTKLAHATERMAKLEKIIEDARKSISDAQEAHAAAQDAAADAREVLQASRGERPRRTRSASSWSISSSSFEPSEDSAPRAAAP